MSRTLPSPSDVTTKAQRWRVLPAYHRFACYVITPVVAFVGLYLVVDLDHVWWLRGIGWLLLLIGTPITMLVCEILSVNWLRKYGYLAPLQSLR